MAKENKKEWSLVDRLISASHLPESTKAEARKLAKEYRVQPFKAFQMVMNPIYLLEATISKLSPREQRQVAKALMELMKKSNWRQELNKACDRVEKKLKRRPR